MQVSVHPESSVTCYRGVGRVLTREALFLDLVDVPLVSADLHDSLQIDGSNLLDDDLPSSFLFIRAGVTRSLDDTIGIDRDGKRV